MGDARHTPGPWHYQEESDPYTHIVRAGDRFLCQLAQDHTGQAEDDARLIAAAPDLAAALQGLLRFVEEQIAPEFELSQIPEVEAAEAALAKAGLGVPSAS